MKADQFKKLVKEVIDEELDEMSSTAAGGEYNIPAAFTDMKKKKEPKSRKYEAFKGDPTISHRMKIGSAIREISNQLKELDSVLAMSAKLKKENYGAKVSPIYKRTA